MIYGSNKLLQPRKDYSPSVYKARPYGCTKCCTLIAFYLGFTSVFFCTLCRDFTTANVSNLSILLFKCTFFVCADFQMKGKQSKFYCYVWERQESLFFCAAQTPGNDKNCINKIQRRRNTRNHKNEWRRFVGFYVDCMGTF